LRGLGTAADQALALHPTFITVWAGSNDVLGAVLGGTPAALTPLAEFESAYTALLDRLVAGAPNAGMVTATVPSVSNIPFATTIPPVLVNPATRQPVLGPDGKPIFLFADLGAGELGLLPPGSRVTLGASSLMATGYGIPPQLAPNFPQLVNAGKPLPDAVVLTPTELAAIAARVAEINGVITTAAAARNIPVLVIDEPLNRYTAGVEFAGVKLSSAFLTGGIFGLDGVHPSDLGYAMVTNEFIRLINQAYGTRLRQVSITEYFENNAPVEAAFDPRDPVVFSQEATDAVRSITGIDNEVVVTPVRRRAVSH
ncbi:MAG: SGNH/GDSL hydrolase family protein, partial [Thermoanaerobaculia bacterium]